MTLFQPKLVFYILGLIAISIQPARAEMIIDCTVEYFYADGQRAIREQVWEEGWEWRVHGDLLLLQGSSIAASFRCDRMDQATLYGVSLRNRYCQSSFLKIGSDNLDKAKNGKKLIVKKYYNKIILINNAGAPISGNVLFGLSGLYDKSAFPPLPTCPPAAGGGYSFPSIPSDCTERYSLYLIGDDDEITELSFEHQLWYGRTVIERIVVE